MLCPLLWLFFVLMGVLLVKGTTDIITWQWCMIWKGNDGEFDYTGVYTYNLLEVCLSACQF